MIISEVLFWGMFGICAEITFTAVFDLISKKKIGLKDALIGFKFDMKFLDGKVYTINNGGGKIIRPNYRKVIPEMGIKRGERKGNLVIQFSIEFPDTLSDEQKKKIESIL